MKVSGYRSTYGPGFNGIRLIPESEDDKAAVNTLLMLLKNGCQGRVAAIADDQLTVEVEWPQVDLEAIKAREIV